MAKLAETLNFKSRCLYSSVQELEIGKLMSPRSVLLSERPVHFDRSRHFSGDEFISPGVDTSGLGAVETPREENRALGYGSFAFTPE